MDNETLPLFAPEIEDEEPVVLLDAARAAEERGEGIARVLAPKIRQQRIEEMRPIAVALAQKHGVITTDHLYEWYWDKRRIHLAEWLGNAKCLVGVWNPREHWQGIGYFTSTLVSHHSDPKMHWIYVGPGGRSRVPVVRTARDQLALLDGRI